jgi:hypothetical protein
MGIAVMKKPFLETPDQIDISKKNETTYELLSEAEALSITAEIIKEFRPALEELAK